MTTALGTGLRRAAARLAPDPSPDGELLARFLADRDEAAFALLVRRHAKMVFGTCRRVLGNSADADDAFQAAFVVLVRKAHSLTDRTCVGNFLYGVAFHTALKARAMTTTRRAKEAKASRERERPESDELTRVLDEELAKLPDKYREPVVLCELEGVSRKEAAARLGVPEGTISSRLATAHRMLGKRLTARGFASVAVAAVFANQTFAVPDTLAEAAVRTAADGPPAAVTQLASEVSKMLLWNKLKAGAAVLAGVLLLAGVGAMAPGFADDKPAVKAPAPATPDRKVGGEPKKDEELIQGTWEVISGEAEGEILPADALKGLQFQFEGNKATAPFDRGEHTFALDPTAKPKAMNITSTDGPLQGKTRENTIYELDGDTLRLCIDKRIKGGARPTDFTTAIGDGRTSFVLKRVKPMQDEPKAKPPEKKPEADKSYSLKDGEVLKLVAAPFPDEREAVFKQVNRDRSMAGGPMGYRMVIPADGADLRQCFASTSAENGWPLGHALAHVLGIDRMEIVADAKVLAVMVDADALVRPDTPAEKLLPALQAELKAKCGIDVRLVFEQMEREVVVASGTYLKRAGPNEIEPQHEYTLDADEPKGKPNWGAHVFSQGFFPAIGSYVGRPVIDETNLKLLPNIYFSLHEYHHQKPDDPKFKAPDPETVLKRLATQTGLTFKLEKRKVRTLVVTPSDR